MSWILRVSTFSRVFPSLYKIGGCYGLKSNSLIDWGNDDGTAHDYPVVDSYGLFSSFLEWEDEITNQCGWLASWVRIECLMTQSTHSLRLSAGRIRRATTAVDYARYVIPAKPKNTPSQIRLEMGSIKHLSIELLGLMQNCNWKSWFQDLMIFDASNV